MASDWTINDVIARLGPGPDVKPSSAPYYFPQENTSRVMLAVESMRRHMTDEGWELALSLEATGYKLAGNNCVINLTDVYEIVRRLKPGVVVVQDKREWDAGHSRRDFRNPADRFQHIDYLSHRPDIFKLTVLKDAHQTPEYHKESADEMGCHAWITYYHPRIVTHLAPYVRPQHLIRIHHTINPLYFPQEITKRHGGLFSGAVSAAYPLRQRLLGEINSLPEIKRLVHPGYGANGCKTPDFIKELSKYKLAICTASKFGYALRKMVEATAAGCVVLTDLSMDEVLPGGIDGNMVRIHPNWPTYRISNIIREVYDTYDPIRQAEFAHKARTWYDYKAAGIRLAVDIETMRANYNAVSAIPVR